MDDPSQANRKPKYVEIPSVPRSTTCDPKRLIRELPLGCLTVAEAKTLQHRPAILILRPARGDTAPDQDIGDVLVNFINKWWHEYHSVNNSDNDVTMPARGHGRFFSQFVLEGYDGTCIGLIRESVNANNSSSNLGHHGNGKSVGEEEPDPALMARLGIFVGDQNGINQVKTTNHIHPMLSHSNIGIHSNDPKKQTSPASTLSDKGIGSSVGSFDSEFRHDYSSFHPSRLSFHANKTGSLDSRTPDLAGKLLPSHTRSSSDIICQSGPSEPIPHSMLAEQSSVTLWNSDPRRLSQLNPVTSSSSLTSSIRPRRLSLRRQRSRPESLSEKDAEVKKLPQLYRDSSNHSAQSSVSSSSRSITPAVSVCEMVTNRGGQTNGCDSPLNSTLQLPKDDCSVVVQPPTPRNSVAPPLPPKAAHVEASHPPSSNNSPHPDMDRLCPPVASRMGHADDWSANSTLTNRMRLSSDGALSLVLDNPTQKPPPVWSQDTRRETPVTMHLGRQAPLSSSMGMSSMSRTGSLGLIQGGEEKTSGKQHGSTNTLWNDDRGLPPTDDTFKRQTASRSSTRSNPGEGKKQQPDNKVRFAPYRPPEVNLQALQFDLPLAVSSESKFVGRDWVFNEILAALGSKDSKSNRGVVITGRSGHGKTAIVEHLVSHSYQGWRSTRGSKPELDSLNRVNNSRSSSPMTKPAYHGGNSNHSSRTASPAPHPGSAANSRAGSQTSLTEDSSRKVASQIVAYHFCQADNSTTCYLPEFLHSLAAQLTQAPQLTAYRELLINDPHLQNLLSVRSCIQNPSQAFLKAIIEPLVALRRGQKLPRSNLVILIDALSEAEQYRPDYGFSILSFIQHHIGDFPDFIKIVVTCRSEERHIVESLPFHITSLDGENTRVARDMQMYVNHRIATSTVLSNLTLSGKSDSAVAQKQLSQHLSKMANGNFLYLRMTLDLIDQEAIVPKSGGFKVVPTNLKEVFLLQCNLRFRSYSSFDDVRDILSIALASLYPLKDEQIFQAVAASLPPNQLAWGIFKQRMELLDGLLVQSDATSVRIFFHPNLREWLMGQTTPSSANGTLQSQNRFRVDVKRGYALLATVLSRQPIDRLHKHATLELAHHVLKAGMFKGHSKPADMSASEYNAQLMAGSSKQLTEALVSPRNLFYPNIKISKLLLRAGANPNASSQIFSNAPPLAVVAHNGYMTLTQLLLTYGADVNLQAANGMSAVTFAAAAGRLEVVELLLQYQPVLARVDQNGHTPLLHAISRGHSSVAKLLLSPTLYMTREHHLVATQQALVAAATTEDVQLIQFLLETDQFECDVNGLEPSHGESPLTSAAAHGKSSVCEFLIRHYRASLHCRNRSGLTPLLCAVRHGEWDAADLLLNCGATLESTDPGGKTPLIMAACHGHLGVLELLLSRGANVVAQDKEGLAALGWAALQGHAHCARSLIGRSDIHHCDVSGRTALDLAAFYGDPQIVDLLLDAGADIGHVDATGMCALDRAIGSQNIAVVSRLLQRGADIQTMTWAMASGKPDVTTALLNQSLEDGNNLYKEAKFQRASDCYSIALKHVGELAPNPPNHNGKLSDLCAHLLLGYSRSRRKLQDLEGAESSASRSLQLKPHWYEALYARARVLREGGRLHHALRDVMDAERSAPEHNLKEITRLIERIKEEIRKSGTRQSRPPSISSEINIPQQRPRVNSASSYQDNRGTSPSPSMTSELSRSYQPRYHNNRLNPLSGGQPHLGRGNSQESLAESMVSLAPYPTDGALRNGSVRRLPKTNPSWRPQVTDFHRSISEDNRRFTDGEARPAHGGYASASNHLATTRDVMRPSFVTDL